MAATVGMAQTVPVPDAGSTLRELQQRPLAPPAVPGTLLKITPEIQPRAPAATGIPFAIGAVEITGNTVLSTDRLQPLVQSLIGQTRTLADLQEAAARITAFYHQQGYPVARAYIPAQAMKAGTVEIRVLEGRIEQIDLDNRSAIRRDILRAHLAPQRIGEVVNTDRLDRALLLLQDLSGDATIGAVLRPGSATGATDLAIAVQARPLLRASIEADNHGGRATGRARAGVALNGLNVLGVGDHADARIVSSGRGQDYARLALSLPLGADGLRIGVSHVESLYRLGGDFASLDATGRAKVSSLALTYPLVRSRETNVNLALNLDVKDLDDRIGAAGSRSTKRNRIAGIAINADHIARDGAMSTASLQFDSGDLSLRSESTRMADAVAARTAGAYQKVLYSAAHYRPLGADFLWLTSLTGQHGAKNLDSSEKFVLGGPFGVRAYPVGEAAGDSGQLLTLELRAALPASMSGALGTLGAIGFIDSGRVRVNATPFTSSGNYQQLSGAGFGLTVQNPRFLDLRLIYAFKLGNTAARSDTDRFGRAWLQASQSF